LPVPSAFKVQSVSVHRQSIPWRLCPDGTGAAIGWVTANDHRRRALFALRTVQIVLSFFYHEEEQSVMSNSLTVVSGRAIEDRIRRATSPELNRQIDRQTDANILHYANAMPEVIDERIEELDREWDIERLLAVNAGTVALAGLLLGATRDKKWLILPGITVALLVNFNLRGWAPALPVLRHLGLRTRSEIDRERASLLESRADSAGA
jgi:hypothetical protein